MQGESGCHFPDLAVKWYAEELKKKGIRKKIRNLGVNIIELLEDKMTNEETLEEFSKRKKCSVYIRKVEYLKDKEINEFEI